MNQYNKIAVWDTETTGIDVNKDRIIQIAVFLCDMQFNRITDTIEVLINPEMPIPQDSIDVHGITDEMVASAPLFKDVGPGLLEFIKDSHIAGYNVKFDILIIMQELSRIGLTLDMTGRMIIDPYVTLMKMEPRDQSSVYRYYTGKELIGAHGASADIAATHEIMLAQIQKYQEVNTAEDMYNLSEPESRCDLSGKIKMKNGVPVFNFGKNYEKPISEEKNYLSWMLTADMPNDTKQWIENYLNQNKDG